MVRHEHGGPVADPLRHFVGEVLRHLSETGAIYQDATGRWVADESLEQLALPDSVREVTKLRAEVILCAPGSLPNDGKVVEDARRYT